MAIPGLAYFAFSVVTSAVEATTNSPTPLSISLDQVDAAAAGAQHYVRVSGVILPKVVYRHENDSATEWWSPLVDRESRRVILVKRSGSIHPERPHELTVTGMLRGLDSSARSRSAGEGDRIDGLPVDTRYELAADERPGDPRAAVAVAVAVALLFLANCAVMLKRNAIFQAGGNFAAPLVNVTSQPVLVRATGRFRFDAKTARRFSHIGAIVSVENGRPLLQSKIDTSRRFMGVSTGTQVGIWSIPLTPGSLAQGQFGFSYFLPLTPLGKLHASTRTEAVAAGVRKRMILL